NQGENAINNAAAAGGMAGTAEHQQRAGELAENLANQDYYNFLTPALGLYGAGLTGEQNIANLGGNAASSLAESLASLLYQRAKLNYERGASKNKQNSDLFSNIFSNIGNVKDLFS
ncbi:MAG TPA: hypothetical protein VKR58_13275, partial [Aquella sp.]|nr:hypothetical protein [Aquella sp.]